MKIHKMTKQKLVNEDGSYNILCDTKSNHIKASQDVWGVTCKKCLKLID